MQDGQSAIAAVEYADGTGIFAEHGAGEMCGRENRPPRFFIAVMLPSRPR
jgi:hypothetical protein